MIAVPTLPATRNPTSPPIRPLFAGVQSRYACACMNNQPDEIARLKKEIAPLKQAFSNLHEKEESLERFILVDVSTEKERRRT
jgi:hypothetical protein